MSDEILYILVRSDIVSMNPGKMAAQACHGANACINSVKKSAYPIYEMLKSWELQTDQAFGTTVVLDGGTIDNIRNIVETLSTHYKEISTGIVHDPTYPINDGVAIHLIPIDTVAWVFGRKSNKHIVKALDNLELY